MLYSMHLPPSRRLLSLLCAACALLAACGWRLQGAARLPESAAIVYVDAMDPYSEFSRALKRSLQQAGARVVEHRADAAAVIKVRKDNTGQAVQSVSAKNIPQEYAVFYQIEYAVEVSGKEAIEPQTISLSRTYSYNESAMLGKMEEESVLRAALARDLADQVLRRMAALQ